VAFTNGWANFTSSAQMPCEYTKDPLGFVHLRGLAVRGGGTSTLPLFQLPRGYRPKANEIFAQPTATAAVSLDTLRVDIDKDGFVSIPVGDGSGYISLAGITFRAEQ
jgi:hypothetical protein